MGQHTPEPWGSIDTLDPRTDIPTASSRPTECCGSVLLKADDYYRARACVNALAGIPDPAAFVKAARELAATYERGVPSCNPVGADRLRAFRAADRPVPTPGAGGGKENNTSAR